LFRLPAPGQLKRSNRIANPERRLCLRSFFLAFVHILQQQTQIVDPHATKKGIGKADPRRRQAHNFRTPSAASSKRCVRGYVPGRRNSKSALGPDGQAGISCADPAGQGCFSRARSRCRPRSAFRCRYRTVFRLPVLDQKIIFSNLYRAELLRLSKP